MTTDPTTDLDLDPATAAAVLDGLRQLAAELRAIRADVAELRADLARLGAAARAPAPALPGLPPPPVSRRPRWLRRREGKRRRPR